MKSFVSSAEYYCESKTVLKMSLLCFKRQWWVHRRLKCTVMSLFFFLLEKVVFTKKRKEKKKWPYKKNKTKVIINQKTNQNKVNINLKNNLNKEKQTNKQNKTGSRNDPSKKSKKQSTMAWLGIICNFSWVLLLYMKVLRGIPCPQRFI